MVVVVDLCIVGGAVNTDSYISSRYSNLGIDDFYFSLESVETIANHIMSLYGAKILAYTKHENVLAVNLEKESEDSSVYIHSSEPGVSQLQGPQFEKRYSTWVGDGLESYTRCLCMFADIELMSNTWINQALLKPIVLSLSAPIPLLVPP